MARAAAHDTHNTHKSSHAGTSQAITSASAHEDKLPVGEALHAEAHCPRTNSQKVSARRMG